MSESKPDVLAVAVKALGDAARSAREERTTGVLTVEVHLKDGTPNAAQVTVRKVVR